MIWCPLWKSLAIMKKIMKKIKPELFMTPLKNAVKLLELINNGYV